MNQTRTAPVLLFCLGSALSCLGQIVRDGTLGGAPGALTGPNFEIPAALGRKLGPNLFHSFSQFNLLQGESANFSGPADVQNILTRVTGGASSIDGTLKSDIAGANFYFINPNGVMFGPHANVDVSGSFIVTTADYVKLADGVRFSVANPQDSLLSIAPPASFGFLSANPAKTTIDGSHLDTHGLSVVSGDVEIKNGAQVNAPDAVVKLAAIKAAGEFSAAPDRAAIQQGGSIDITGGSRVTVDGPSGGQVVIRAGRLMVADTSEISCKTTGEGDGLGLDVAVQGELTVKDDSKLTSRTYGAGHSGPVKVVAGDVSLLNGGFISTSTFGAGDAGELSLAADSLMIDGISSSGSAAGLFATSSDGGGGKAGRIDVFIQGSTWISSGGKIQASSFGLGDAGRVSLTAGSLLVDGQNSTVVTGILSDSQNHGQSGHGGDVSISVQGEARVVNGGEIRSDTFGLGDAGKVSLTAGSLLIDRQDSTVVTGISSDSVNSGQGGHGGNVSVSVLGEARVANGGEIKSSTFGSGDAGRVSLTAGSLLVDGQNSTFVTGILSDSYNNGEGGHGGDVSVSVQGEARVVNGGEIRCDTFGLGDAGKVSLTAGSLLIDRQDSTVITGVSSDSVNSGQGGHGGDVSVSIQAEARVVNGGGIRSSTFGSGDAGKVSLTAGSLLVDAQNSTFVTGILSDSVNSGQGGHGGDVSVSIQGNARILNGGEVRSDTFGLGDAGRVSLMAGSMLIDGQNGPGFTGIASDSDNHDQGGNAGDVNVTIQGLGKIVGEGAISSDTRSSGNAGQVTVTAKDFVIDGGGSDNPTYISSDTLNHASGGNAGRVAVAVTDLLQIINGGEISSDTYGLGKAGSVSVTAGSILIDGQNGPSFTGISSDSNNDNQGGNAGDVTVTIRGLGKIVGEGAISSDTCGSGNAGRVNVSARRLVINGGGSDDPTYISSDTLNEKQGGQAGDVNVTVQRSARLVNGAEISSDTSGLGNAGNVTLSAGTLVIDGRRSDVTTDISSASLSETEGGNAGSVDIAVRDATRILAEGYISSATVGLGDAGHVFLHTGSLLIDGEGSDSFTGLTAATRSSDQGGRGGDIEVTAKRASLNDGFINALSLSSGDAGSVQLKAGCLFLSGQSAIRSSSENTGNSGTVDLGIASWLHLNGGSSITAAADKSNGEGITIHAGADIVVKDSRITASAALDGGNIEIATPSIVSLSHSRITSEAGNNGGNIHIDPQFVTLGRSRISANAVNGNGGNILIDAGYLIQSMGDSSITASSKYGLNGQISILGPSVDLSSSVVPLSASLLGADSRLPEQCGKLLSGEVSSFIILGRGGIAISPDGWQPALVPSD